MLSGGGLGPPLKMRTSSSMTGKMLLDRVYVFTALPSNLSRNECELLISFARAEDMAQPTHAYRAVWQFRCGQVPERSIAVGPGRRGRTNILSPSLSTVWIATGKEPSARDRKNSRRPPNRRATTAGTTRVLCVMLFSFVSLTQGSEHESLNWRSASNRVISLGSMSALGCTLK